MLDLKWQGLTELQAKLSLLDAALQGEVLERAVVAAALPIQNAAKEKAPVKTGNLRRSIHTEPERIAGGARAIVGTDVVYAARLEFGFMGADSLGRVYHQPARPYLRPAFDEQREAAISEGRAVIAALVEEALAG